MAGAARNATHLGLALVLGGFGAIFLAWDGASELDHIQGQFPYLVSGGVAGLGLIAVGAGILVVQTLRRAGAEERRHIAALADGLEQVVAQVRETGVGEQVRAAVPTSVERTQPPVEAVPAGTVVAGRASYHDPSCHLVAERSDLPFYSRSAAAGEGLRPCQVCKP